MKLSTRIRYGLARMLRKSAGLTIVPSWVPMSWTVPLFRNLVSQGYARNAAYFACIEALAFSFPEPPLLVYEDDSDSAAPLPNHPIRKLLTRPNDDMGEDAFQAAIVTWLAIGGNCYLHKLRNSQRQVIGLMPYHDGTIATVPLSDPTARSWVKEYTFTNGDGEPITIPKEDIIHIKWPSLDPFKPWQAQPPIVAAAREVDSDNEATRFVATLLANDATPRTVITPDSELGLTPDEAMRFRAQWQETHGGDNRGGVAIMEFRAKIERLALNMDELGFAALHDIPEQRICAVMRVPTVVAGLGDDPTYANSEEAWRRFTRATLAPLWGLVASAIQAGLAADFGNDVAVRHHLGRVQALQEDESAKWARVNAAFTAGFVGFGEARAAVGLPAAPPADDVFVALPTRELLSFADLSAPVLVAAPAPPKLLTGPIEAKASAQRTAAALSRVRLTVARRMEPKIAAYFEQLAADVLARAGKAATAPVATNGHGPAVLTKALPSVDELIEVGDGTGLTTLFRTFTLEVLSASWETWNAALDMDIAFAQSDPAVVAALAQSGDRIKDILDTTKNAVRGLLRYGAEQGWGIAELVAGDADHPGLRAVVQQTYKGRARAIARTELAMGQATASAARFESAGVARVLIFDGGGDDSDDVCNQLNGTTQTLAWYQANPIGHPNCVRAAGAVFD